MISVITSTRAGLPLARALLRAGPMSEGFSTRMVNAPTRLMKELGYGEDYQYAHNFDEKLTAMECLPESLKGRRYYLPTTQGREARVKERLEQILEWKKKASE